MAESFEWKNKSNMSDAEFSYKTSLIKAGMPVDDVMKDRKIWLNLDRGLENRGGPPAIRQKDEITAELQRAAAASPGSASVDSKLVKYWYPEEVASFDYISYSATSYSGNRNNQKIKLMLPMPAELSEQLEAGWTAQDNWLAATANLSTSMATAINKEFTEGVGKTGLWENATEFIVSKFGGQGTLQKTLERGRGRVVNPVAEQFFTGMSHRTWEFMHKIVAETEDEARVINDLINSFKMAASTQIKAEDPYFMQWPLIWDVKFMMPSLNGVAGTDVINNYLPTLNKCAVTQIATNFSGAGTWARHIDGAPVEIDLTVSLTELTIPTAANFDKDAGIKQSYGFGTKNGAG